MAGIRVSGKSQVTIIGGSIERNGGGGLVIDGESTVDVRGGTKIRDNYGDGVAVSGEGSIVTVEDADISNNGLEQAYRILGVDRAYITEEQLEALINKAISTHERNHSSSSVVEDVLTWANNTAIFATVAGSDPLVVAVSGVVAYGVSNLKALKEKLISS
ncbi:right-handed parallel beta-helix repeat-containing protein [Marinomonas shanghaiensis]|uniref:right-handed parallel beta-helix repeat-containing protein n=1 Tax=Marinomonas shanghaiensis TaxID=2202418 RepID=UPI000DB8FAF3|nr:right-handed parallel beta-helix repeat-containing protein [Marinomonas shanghaiensis]